jgi:hypothetical protein
MTNLSDMKSLIAKFYFGLATFTVLMGVMTTGCGKKPPETPPVATADTNTAVVDAQAPPPVSPTAPAPQAAVDPSEVGGKVAEAKAALTSKDYDKASTALSVPDTTIAALTPDQRAAYYNAKNSMTHSVIAAALAGDPKAKAVVAKMQDDALHHR